MCIRDSLSPTFRTIVRLEGVFEEDSGASEDDEPSSCGTSSGGAGQLGPSQRSSAISATLDRHPTSSVLVTGGVNWPHSYSISRPTSADCHIACSSLTSRPTARHIIFIDCERDIIYSSTPIGSSARAPVDAITWPLLPGTRARLAPLALQTITCRTPETLYFMAGHWNTGCVFFKSQTRLFSPRRDDLDWISLSQHKRTTQHCRHIIKMRIILQTTKYGRIQNSDIKESANLTKYTTNTYFSAELCIYRFGAKNLNTPAQQLSRCPAVNSDENSSSRTTSVRH